jgi:hypothetical protein
MSLWSCIVCGKVVNATADDRCPGCGSYLPDLVDVQPDLEAIEAQKTCEHEWTGQRLGGAPDDAGSYEWVGFCKKCGVEGPDD